MRLIDADELLKDKVSNAYVSRFEIENAPTIDAEPVIHAHWKTDEEDIKWGNYLKKKRCSNCNVRPYYDKETQKFILSKHCPHCGAEMDEEINK